MDDLISRQPETHGKRTETHACDCISRQAAMEALGERPHLWTGCNYELGCANQYDLDKLAIETVPSAQTERPKGKWITQEFGSWAECSECHELYDIPMAYSNFCPNCRADMRGEQDG